MAPPREDARLDPLRVGGGLLSGRIGGAWQVRAQKLGALLEPLVGPAPPGLATLNAPDPPRPGLRALRPTRRHRALAQEHAFACSRHLFAGRFDRLAPLLGDALWVLWPEQQLARHPKAELIQHLGARSITKLDVRLSGPRTYAYEDLRLWLAKGIPEGLGRILGLDDAALVTFEVRARHPGGGAMRTRIAWPVALEPLRATGLPMVAPDDALLVSQRARRADRPREWAAEQVVTKVLLGQALALDSLRPLFAPKIWLREQVATPDELVAEIAAVPQRIAAGDTVLLGSRTAPFRELATLAPGRLTELLRAAAPDLFDEPLEALAPVVVVVELGLFDPATQATTPKSEALAVVVSPSQAPGPQVLALVL